MGAALYHLLLRGNSDLRVGAMSVAGALLASDDAGDGTFDETEEMEEGREGQMISGVYQDAFQRHGVTVLVRRTDSSSCLPLRVIFVVDGYWLFSTFLCSAGFGGVVASETPIVSMDVRIYKTSRLG